jgi:hypothetical protein
MHGRARWHPRKSRNSRSRGAQQGSSCGERCWRPGSSWRLVRHGRRDRRLRRRRPAGHLRREQDRRSCRLFRNLGNWKFEDVTEKAGVATRQRRRGLEAGRDVRRRRQQRPPGHLRLPLQRPEPPLHQPGRRHVQGGGPRLRARGERRLRDGGLLRLRPRRLPRRLRPDQPPGRSPPNGQRDYLFHNNGDGTFTDVTDRAGISGEAQGHSAVWWDYDGDGWPDLYVANDFAAPDKLYHNNRDGTFTDAIDRWSRTCPIPPWAPTWAT